MKTMYSKWKQCTQRSQWNSIIHNGHQLDPVDIHLIILMAIVPMDFHCVQWMCIVCIMVIYCGHWVLWTFFAQWSYTVSKMRPLSPLYTIHKVKFPLRLWILVSCFMGIQVTQWTYPSKCTVNRILICNLY